MRKFAALFLLLSLLASFVPTLHAQTRPRRVGQTGGSVPTTPQAGNEPGRARRPPMLGGAVGSHEDSSTRAGNTASGNEPEEVDENEVVRVNTSLVTIPVSVMDRQGKYMPSIRQNEFRIWEEGVEQEIAYFATVEKPFTVALVIDTSGSTRYRLTEIQDAAIAFVNQLRPDDRVLVVSFDDEVMLLTEATSDRANLRDAIRYTRPGEGTKLYDAVDFVINECFEHIDGRKAVVLFTDGVDTTSRDASYQSTARDAEELDALIYPVQYDTYLDSGIQSGGGTRGGSGSKVLDILGGILSGGNVSIGTGGGNKCVGCTREEHERGSAYLQDLARLTGARLYRADTTRDIAGAFSLVAEELRRQYSLGYYPKQQGQPGQRRRIKVRVNRPDLAVQARDSYIFNPSGTNTTTAPTTTAQDDERPRSQPVLRRWPLTEK